MTDGLIDEATKKAAVAWIAVRDAPALALWCMPLDGALYVVSGPGEQDAPGLTDAARATVTLRGDHGGRIVTWAATVERITPGSEAWNTVAPQLAGKRLNASGSTENVVARWAADGCAVVRLSPAGEGEDARHPGDLPDGSQAAVPRDSPARVPVRRPWHLHRVRRRR